MHRLLLTIKDMKRDMPTMMSGWGYSRCQHGYEWKISPSQNTDFDSYKSNMYSQNGAVLFVYIRTGYLFLRKLSYHNFLFQVFNGVQSSPLCAMSNGDGVKHSCQERNPWCQGGPCATRQVPSIRSIRRFPPHLAAEIHQVFPQRG